MKSIFTDIYENNRWKSNESRSGPGSHISRTHNLRNNLLKVIKKYSIKSIIDIPCGDLNWISPIIDLLPNYIGIDIVDELIIKNKKKFPNKIFYCDNLLTTNKINCDLLIVRDCLFHFSQNDVILAFKNIIKNNTKYILVTEIIDKKHLNKNIKNGTWYPIALQNSPYNFPVPVLSIKEDAINKYMSLWKVSDLKSIFDN